MFARAQEIIDYLEELAPLSLALEGDPVGLQVGDPGREVENIIVALDLDKAVFDEALRAGAQMIITHHPFIYRPLSLVDTRWPLGKLLAGILKNDLIVYSAHTNLDIAPRGVNYTLAELFNLKKTAVLQVTGYEPLEKLVVFVPQEKEEQVREALAGAGAGWIGNYSHCTFCVSGTGTFKPREGTSPYIGSIGKVESVGEVRLETVSPVRLRNEVLEALLKAHPYEEVAYDLIPLNNQYNPYGLGIVGKLTDPCSLGELAERTKKLLKTDYLKVSGSLSSRVQNVAVCGGSGGSLIKPAVNCGADVFITGDIKYHEAREAQAYGLAMIDAGHDYTEQPIIFELVNYLKERLAGEGFQTIVRSAVPTTPWQQGNEDRF